MKILYNFGDVWIIHKNLAPDARIKLANAVFFQVVSDWLYSLEDGKRTPVSI